MLTRRAVLGALLAGPLLIGVLDGCSHPGPVASSAAAAAGTSAAPERSKGAVTQSSGAFCTFITSTNAILTKATSQQQGLTTLTTLAPRLQQEQPVAPASVSAEFAIVVAAVQQARAEGTPAPLATDQVATAGASLTSYCHSRS
jgi:hypothetical protein